MISIDFSLEEKLVSLLVAILVVYFGREVGLFHFDWDFCCFYSCVAEAVDSLSPHHE